MYWLNMLSCAIIFVWCTWCVLCPSVRDGLLGKTFFILGALSALGVIFGPQEGYESQKRLPEVLLNAAMALMGLRHMALRYVWPIFMKQYRCACERILKE